MGNTIAVGHTLLYFKKMQMYPTDDEMKIIKELIQALGIIETASRRLCRREVNLAKADRIYEWMLRKLDELESNVSDRLRNEVGYRISERRPKKVATLLAYLENPMFLDLTKDRLLKYATKPEIKEMANDILLRLYPSLISQQTNIQGSIMRPYMDNVTLSIDIAHSIMDSANAKHNVVFILLGN